MQESGGPGSIAVTVLELRCGEIGHEPLFVDGLYWRYYRRALQPKKLR